MKRTLECAGVKNRIRSCVRIGKLKHFLYYSKRPSEVCAGPLEYESHEPPNKLAPEGDKARRTARTVKIPSISPRLRPTDAARAAIMATHGLAPVTPRSEAHAESVCRAAGVARAPAPAYAHALASCPTLSAPPRGPSRPQAARIRRMLPCAIMPAAPARSSGAMEGVETQGCAGGAMVGRARCVGTEWEYSTTLRGCACVRFSGRYHPPAPAALADPQSLCRDTLHKHCSYCRRVRPTAVRHPVRVT